MLIKEFRDIKENDVSRRSDAKRGYRLVEQDEEGLCSDSPRHRTLNEMGQTASFVKKVRGETQIDDCCRSETRRTGSFIVEPREEPQRENQRDDGGRHRLGKGRAAMLVDQEKIKLPSDVPRHSVPSERIDVRTSNKGVDVRTSSRGQLGLKNNNDHRLPNNDSNE